MAFNKKDKNIENLFYKDTRELREDKSLKNDSILNNFKNEHSRIMNEHAEEYTNLLKKYIQNSETSAMQKKWFKNIFFIVAILMLSSSFFLFAGISKSLVMQKWNNIDATALTGLISALVGLLSLYIVIPKIIARYLFNEKEDENMTRIVESIQKYDEIIFDRMNSYSFGEAIEIEGGKNVISSLKRQIEDNNQAEELDIGKHDEEIDNTEKDDKENEPLSDG